MPRKLRMFQANMPCHVISRGNNPCFIVIIQLMSRIMLFKPVPVIFVVF